MRKRDASHVREAIEKWLYLFIYFHCLVLQLPQNFISYRFSS